VRIGVHQDENRQQKLVPNQFQQLASREIGITLSLEEIMYEIIFRVRTGFLKKDLKKKQAL